MEKKDLSLYREKIDGIDKELVRLFAERMEVAEAIGTYKREMGLPVLDAARERAKLAEVADMAPEDMQEYTKVLYSLLFELSRSHQQTLQNGENQLYNQVRNAIDNTPALFPEDAVVACQGTEGAYSTSAAEKLFRTPRILYCKTFEAVLNAVENGLFSGISATTFEPETPMTRAMLVTVLWRYAGKPIQGKNSFTDVPNGQWYSEAVTWAAHNGVVAGVGNNRFDPESKITREQMAAILFRYANKVGIDTSKRATLSFPDAGKVSGYAKDALQWAVAEGLVSGSKEGNVTYLHPQGNATRAQVASILMRFIQNVAK